MNLKTLVIYQNIVLYNILLEISKKINFRIIHLEELNLSFFKKENQLVISTKKIPEVQNQLIIDNLPIKLNKLIELININFLKQEYNLKSSILVGKYELNLNSRTLSLQTNDLDLTEMEAKVILFIKNSKEPVSVKKLQNEVWKHVPDLETHTVETHIYRLRKKIKEKFEDENFIKSLKNGYKIN